VLFLSLTIIQYFCSAYTVGDTEDAVMLLVVSCTFAVHLMKLVTYCHCWRFFVKCANSNNFMLLFHNHGFWLETFCTIGLAADLAW